jgi:alanyl-tRNA synthetase
LIGIQDQFCSQLVQPVLEIYSNIYLELKNNKEFIEQQLIGEEEKFFKGLNVNTHLMQKSLTYKIKGESFSAKEAFDFYQRSGFPIEMIEEIVKENGFNVVPNFREEFQKEFQKHQELSRTASAGMFKAGLADHSEIVVKYHTATHLLHKALQIVLGDHIGQKGSNITAERLRFDFSHPQKMTEEEIKKVEDIVNEKIKESLLVIMEEMTLDQAKKIGATALFAEKYGDKVKVYSMGPSENSGQAFSKEVCGGPHVQNTSELGKFKIIKEEAVSSGVRRIKATLE